jgi:RNA polymerase sigma factor (sigma-70 family)
VRIEVHSNDLERCLVELGESEVSPAETTSGAPNESPRQNFPRLSIERQVELAKNLRRAIKGCEVILDTLPRKAEFLNAIIEDQLERIERGEKGSVIFDLQGRQSSVKLVRNLVERADRASLPIKAWQLRPGFVLELASRMVEESTENPRLEKLCPDAPESRSEPSANATSAYVRESPKLTMDTEPLECLRNYVQTAEDALELLTQTFQRLVTWVATRYRHPGLSLDELISEGNQGLMKGLERYDPERGNRPSTFLFYPVREAILVYQRGRGHVVKYPPSLLALRDRIAHKQEESMKNGKPRLGLTELEDSVKASRERILEALSIQSDLSLEQPISNSDEGELLDLLSAEQDPYGENGDEVEPANGHDPKNHGFENSAESRTNDPPEETLLTEKEDDELTEAFRQFLRKFSTPPLSRRKVWELFRSGTGKWPGEVRLKIVRARGKRRAVVKARASLRVTGVLKFID